MNNNTEILNLFMKLDIDIQTNIFFRYIMKGKGLENRWEAIENFTFQPRIEPECYIAECEIKYNKLDENTGTTSNIIPIGTIVKETYEFDTDQICDICRDMVEYSQTWYNYHEGKAYAEYKAMNTISEFVRASGGQPKVNLKTFTNMGNDIVNLFTALRELPIERVLTEYDDILGLPAFALNTVGAGIGGLGNVLQFVKILKNTKHKTFMYNMDLSAELNLKINDGGVRHTIYRYDTKEKRFGYFGNQLDSQFKKLLESFILTKSIGVAHLNSVDWAVIKYEDLLSWIKETNYVSN